LQILRNNKKVRSKVVISKRLHARPFKLRSCEHFPMRREPSISTGFCGKACDTIFFGGEWGSSELFLTPCKYFHGVSVLDLIPALREIRTSILPKIKSVK